MLAATYAGIGFGNSDADLTAVFDSSMANW